MIGATPRRRRRPMALVTAAIGATAAVAALGVGLALAPSTGASSNLPQSAPAVASASTPTAGNLQSASLLPVPAIAPAGTATTDEVQFVRKVKRMSQRLCDAWAQILIDAQSDGDTYAERALNSEVASDAAEEAGYGTCP